MVFRVRVEDSPAEELPVPLLSGFHRNPFSLPGDDRRGPGVLAHGKHAFGGDRGVHEERGDDIAVVRRGFGIAQDRGHLFEVRGAEIEGEIVEGFLREQAERLRFHDEMILPAPGYLLHVGFRQEPE